MKQKVKWKDLSIETKIKYIALLIACAGILALLFIWIWLGMPILQGLK